MLNVYVIGKIMSVMIFRVNYSDNIISILCSSQTDTTTKN